MNIAGTKNAPAVINPGPSSTNFKEQVALEKETISRALLFTVYCFFVGTVEPGRLINIPLCNLL